jgi:cell division inhibitor SulA
MFSGVVLVDGRPERSSLLTDVCPTLKRLYHKKVSLWLMALSLKASCSFQWVSAAAFLRLKQNLMQILCSLKSVILVVKKIARLLKHNLRKTH